MSRETLAEAPAGDVSPRIHWSTCAVLLAAALYALAGMRSVILGDNANSRLATVFALVHGGTMYIDVPVGGVANPFADTVDKVEVNGHLISSKPPVLPLFMAAQYALAHKALGWRLDDPAHLKRLVQLQILTVSIIPYLLAIVCFARTIAWFTPGAWARTALVTALAFGTMLPGFAPQINNHVPAAAALVYALYLAIGIDLGKLPAAPWRFAMFGLASGLVFAVDVPLTIFVVCAGLPLLLRHPRATLTWAAAGAALPVALHAFVLWRLTGNPLPVQLHREWFLYESSMWRNPLGIDGLNEPKATYAFHMLLGRHGTFLLFPVLAFGLIGGLSGLRGLGGPSRQDALWQAGGLAAFCVLTAYYIRSTDNYGGSAYGFRWHLGAMPVLLVMAAPFAQHLRKAGWAVFAACLIVSTYSALQCWRDPWTNDAEWTVRWIFGPTL